MSISRIALLLALLVLFSAPASADEIVLKDGTIIRGELTGFDGGVYTVRIGRFQKAVPDAQVAEVRSGTPVPPAPAASAAAGAATAGGGRTGAPARPAGAAGASRVPSPPVAPRTAPGDARQVLEKLGLGGPGQGGAGGMVEQIMERGGQATPAELESLQNNPAMQKLVERFSDPNYQQSLIDGLQEFQDKENPGQKNPLVDHLRSLFDQLNSARGGHAAPAGAGGHPAPARPAAPAPQAPESAPTGDDAP